MKKIIGVLSFCIMFMITLLPTLVFATSYNAETFKNKLQNAEIVGGNIVKLTSNVNIDNDNMVIEGDVILDLNGKTLTLNGGVLASAPAGSSGSLTIRDSVGEGKIIGTGPSNNGTVLQAQEGATLTIEGGTIENSQSKVNGATVVVINKAKLVMTGGTIIGKQQGGIKSQDEGTIVEITGGTVQGVSENPLSLIPAVRATKSSSIIITGGNIKSNAQAVSIGYTGSKGEKDDSTITLGGNVNIEANDGDGYPGVGIFHGGTINIQDNATIKTSVVAFENGIINISGGSITSKSYAVATNGSNSGDDYNTNNGAIINISGGTITSGQTVPGVYLPAGTLNFSGGTVTGGVGVLVARGGKAKISDNAILISNSTTGGIVEAIKGKNPVPVGSLIVDGSLDNSDDINVYVSGGNFTGNVIFVNDNLAVDDVNEKLVVSGGKYSNPGKHLKNYIEENVLAVVVNNTTYVGLSAEKVVSSLAKGNKLIVLQVSKEDSFNLPAGVEVVNKTGGVILVNGDQIDQGGDIYTVDESELVANINEAEKIVNDGYTEQSWKNFQDALKNANDVKKNRDLADINYQDKIDNANVALIEAIKSLKKVDEINLVNPPTGDNSHLNLWISLIIMSTCGICILFYRLLENRVD